MTVASTPVKFCILRRTMYYATKSLFYGALIVTIVVNANMVSEKGTVYTLFLM